MFEVSALGDIPDELLTGSPSCVHLKVGQLYSMRTNLLYNSLTRKSYDEYLPPKSSGSEKVGAATMAPVGSYVKSLRIKRLLVTKLSQRPW